MFLNYSPIAFRVGLHPLAAILVAAGRRGATHGFVTVSCIFSFFSSILA